MSTTALVTAPRAVLSIDPADCELAHGPNLLGLCEWCGRAVPASRERWCSVECQRIYDEAHLWPLARSAALRRAAGRCRRCGTRDAVEVHHHPPVDPEGGYGPSCAHHPEHLTVLCRKHHLAEHANLRAKPGQQLALFRAA